MLACGVMSAEESGLRQVALKATEPQKQRWYQAAAREGLDFAGWARRALDALAAGRTAGVTPPDDPEFQAAVEDLRFAMGIRDPADEWVTERS